MSNQDWKERDLAHVWHPCTQMKDHEFLPLTPIESAKGVWLKDFDGKQYLDAVSSWWVNILGHTNPKISEAIKRQVDQLEHVIIAGFTHGPVVELSEKLVEITPKGLTRCFYADNGSSAIEVALKMSFHYWQIHGKTQKTEFLCLKNSYHGETMGALSVGDVDLYKSTYEPLLLKATAVEGADLYDKPDHLSAEEYTRQQFKHMEEALAANHENVCAVIVEPLVQCAGNMRMYDPLYLKLLRDACTRYGVHLIADEIAVGFGRTGTLFACEQAGITPDLMCLSKGLTGGFLPLATTLTCDEIYNAFYDDYATLKAFLHSHSFTGNPLGCAAALATIKELEEGQWIQKNQRTSQLIRELGSRFEDHPHIGDIRQTGMIWAAEMVKDKVSKEPYPWQERRGIRVYQHALENGMLLRPLGNVSYVMPPYVINESELEQVFDVLESGIALAVKD